MIATISRGSKTEFLGVRLGRGQRGLDRLLGNLVGVGDPVAHTLHLVRERALVLEWVVDQRRDVAQRRLVEDRRDRLRHGARGLALDQPRRGHRQALVQAGGGGEGRNRGREGGSRSAHLAPAGGKGQHRGHGQFGSGRFGLQAEDVAVAHIRRTRPLRAEPAHAHETNGKNCTVRQTARSAARLTRERLESSCVFHGVLHAVA
jgi:hypothetical protein